ncbi:helix-turn-helix domain-containing protein [Sphingobium sp. CR28]|uniref:helix-turn-helix domain-containing protein n=1 Tax=Sphingobium sp. CR28 TaxID=3400272 RepID=UPI003FF05594
MAGQENSKGKGFHSERYRSLIKKLVEARNAAGLSQSALALKLGTHQQFVSRYEIGERRLDVVEFIDIARLLNVDLAILTELPQS